MTIHQVDPVALRQKLLKLGIGAKFPNSASFAEDAVKEAIRWGRVPEVPGPLERCAPAGCPELRLSPAELAYMVNAWSRLWEVPE